MENLPVVCVNSISNRDTKRAEIIYRNSGGTFKKKFNNFLMASRSSEEKFYTGIGSRVENVPEEFHQMMKNIGFIMAIKGYTLRSGAATGSDTFFEAGCKAAKGEADIFLPWPFFNKRLEVVGEIRYIVLNAEQIGVSRAIMLAYGILPFWDKMGERSIMFHSRNVNQVLGRLDKPSKSDVTIFYAPQEWDSDEVVGGTRTAVLLSKVLEIPRYNLFVEEEREALLKKINYDEYVKQFKLKT